MGHNRRTCVQDPSNRNRTAYTASDYGQKTASRARRCRVCGESGHDKRKCELFKKNVAHARSESARKFKNCNLLLEKYGIGPGALVEIIKPDFRIDNKWVSENIPQYGIVIDAKFDQFFREIDECFLVVAVPGAEHWKSSVKNSVFCSLNVKDARLVVNDVITGELITPLKIGYTNMVNILTPADTSFVADSSFTSGERGEKQYRMSN